MTSLKEKQLFWKGAIHVLFFYVVSDVLNYLFQAALTHMTAIEELEFYRCIHVWIGNALTFFVPLSILICREVAGNRDRPEKYAGICIRGFQIFMVLTILICVSGIFLYPYISDKLKWGGFSLWIIVLLIIGVAGLYTILHGILQGLCRFRLYGLAECSLIFTQVALSFFCVKLGMGYRGIILATFLGYLVINGILLNYLKRDGMIEKNAKKEETKIWDSIKLYGMVFVVSVLCSFYLNRGGGIFLNTLFDKGLVREYEAVFSMGKPGLSVLSAASVVLLPTIVWGKKEGRNIKFIFLEVMAVGLTFSMVYGWFLYAFGEKMGFLIYGKQWEHIGRYMNAVIIFIVPLGVLSIIQNYFVGIGKIERYMCMLGIATAGVMCIVSFVIKDMVYVPVIWGIALYVVIIRSLLYVCSNG